MQCKFDFLFYSTHQPGTYVDMHKHNCYELVYYVSGTGMMNLNGEWYPYSANTITLTRPDNLHDERHDTRTDVIFIGFTYDDYPVPLANGIYMDDERKTLLTLLLQMKQEMLEKKPLFSVKLDILTQLIVIELERSGKKVSALPDSEKLLHSRLYIDENFSQKLNMPQLAQISGYSYDYFRHLFKRSTGLSPVQYLIQRRVSQAKLELVNTDKKLASIAMDCGFSTTSQFSRLFKELTGEQPVAYRKRTRSRSGAGSQTAGIEGIEKTFLIVD
ncbi:helix-turn-helix domain-containing protein [Paenibacillus montanisoli]|nr:AraC family transcriptional regulator [Paenibacillus montanisoli]